MILVATSFVITAYYFSNWSRLRLFIFCIGTVLSVAALVQISFPYGALKLDPGREIFVEGYLEEFYRSLILYVIITKSARSPTFVFATAALIYGFLEIALYNNTFIQGVIYCMLPNSECEGSYFSDAFKNDITLFTLAVAKSAIHFLLLLITFYALKRSVVLFVISGPILHGALNSFMVSTGIGL